MILATSDFDSGMTSISQGNYSDLDSYLSSVKENAIIKRILGETLGQEFIDDLTGSPSRPQAAKFTTIFNELQFDYSGLPYYTCGLYEVLKYLTFAEYSSQQSVINQSGGNMGVTLEASEMEGLISRSDVILNRAVMNIHALQLYVQDNSATYTDYDGVIFEYNSPI